MIGSSIFSKLGKTVGEASDAYKKEANRALTDAKEKFGILVWTTQNHADRREVNMKMYLVMFNPNKELSERLLATMIFLENNLDYIESSEDQHAAKALQALNSMTTYWMRSLDVISRMEKLRYVVRGKNLTIESQINSVLGLATMDAMEYILDVKSFVDTRGHSKADHIPQTIVVGTAPPPLPNQVTIQSPTRPVADNNDAQKTEQTKPVV